MEDTTVTTESTGALALYTNRATIEDFLQNVRKEVESHVPDISTEKGRKAIASLAYKVSQTKSAADKKRLELTADLRARVSEINELGGVVTTELEKLRDQARRPLTEWEEKEEKRVDACKEAIAILKDKLTSTADLGEFTLNASLQHATTMVIEMPAFADFLDEARAAQNAAIEHLTRQIATAKQLAEQAAELARMREVQAENERKEQERLAKEAAENAERERQAQAERDRIEQERLQKEREEAEAERIRVAAETARKEAEEKAERERKEADEKREAEHKAALAKAEQDRLDEISRMEAKAKAEREAAEAEAARKVAELETEARRKQEEAEAETLRLRIAEQDRLAKVAREQAEADAREKNAQHRAAIRSKAMLDLVSLCDLSTDEAGKVFDAIAVGIVSNISVQF